MKLNFGDGEYVYLHENSDDTLTIKASNLIFSSNNPPTGVRKLYTVSVGTTWTGDAAPYSQTISVSGLLATDTPFITPIFDGADASANNTILEQYRLISRAVTGSGNITLYSFYAKPTSAFKIQLMVIR